MAIWTGDEQPQPTDLYQISLFYDLDRPADPIDPALVRTACAEYDIRLNAQVGMADDWLAAIPPTLVAELERYGEFELIASNGVIIRAERER